MAHSAGVTWICDRCRKQVTLDDGQTPEGWKEVAAFPIEQIRPTPDRREWEICGACYSQMERLLMNTEAPEPNRTIEDGPRNS